MQQTPEVTTMMMMMEPPPSPASAPPTRHDLPSLRLAALARQGSAAALQLLAWRCLQGEVKGRVEALLLLPGLMPFQPVWPILDQVDVPAAPPPIRRAVAQVRALLDDPRECKAVYRSVQRALTDGSVEAERRRASRPPRREHLLLFGTIIAALYDYRFEMADGCLGDLRDRHLQEFLLEYAPRRLLLGQADRPMVPRILVSHLAWLCQIGYLLKRPAQRLSLLCLQLGPKYLEAARAPVQPGSPRAALRAALTEDIDPDDALAVGRFLVLHALDLHEEFAPLFS